MKFLGDSIDLKIFNKINNPFRRTYAPSTKIVEESLYKLSFSYMSLSSSLSISSYAREVKIKNIRSIRSRGSTLQFVPNNGRKPAIKLMPSIDELAVLRDVDGGIFYWISDEDEVYPLLDMGEIEYTNGLCHSCFMRTTPLSLMNSIFY